MIFALYSVVLFVKIRGDPRAGRVIVAPMSNNGFFLGKMVAVSLCYKPFLEFIVIIIQSVTLF